MRAGGAARAGAAALLASALAAACATDRRERPLPAPSGVAALLASAAPAARAERVVLVTVHGLVPAAYLEPDTPIVMPTLAALAAAGIAAESVRPVFPPAIYPAHTTLVSGRSPAGHGVVADRRIGERGVRSERFRHASAVRAPTLWEQVGQAGGRVAALDWPATAGAAIAELLPDVDGRRATWADAIAEQGTPRVADAARRAGAADPDARVPGARRDAVLAAVACELLAGEAPPQLVLLRLSQTEAVLRAPPGGPGSVRTAFARTDEAIASLVSCLAHAGRLESTALAVAGDTGTLPIHTAVRPNAVLAAVGLVVTAGNGGVRRWDALARSNGGSAFVYATNEDAALLARGALAEEARRSGAFRILAADDMVRRGGDPEAWFGLEAVPGFAFEDAVAGPALVAAAVRGVGGYASDDPRMRTGFVAWGAGLRGPLRVPEMEQTDVAPTLAVLLGLPLPDPEGRVLVGLLASRGGGLVVEPARAVEAGDGP